MKPENSKFQPYIQTRLLSVSEVAYVLNVSRSFIYKQISAGQIPALHLGRAIRINPDDLKVYIDRNLAVNQPTLYAEANVDEPEVISVKGDTMDD